MKSKSVHQDSASAPHADASPSANCYDCIYRYDLPGDEHSGCTNILAHVAGDNHGIHMGWFHWPYNFDPRWLKSCDGFTPKTSVPLPVMQKREPAHRHGAAMSSGYPLGSASDPAAPWNCADIDPRILTRADDLCAAGFDDGDAQAHDWLGDELPDDVRSVVLAAGMVLQRPDDPDARLNLDTAWQKLRDRFVQDCREMYREAATEELTDGVLP